MTKQETIAALNKVIEILDNVNKTLDELFLKHMEASKKK